MADDDTAHKLGLAGGAGLGLVALLRVCSHEASVVDDVARLGARGAEALPALADDAGRAAAHAVDGSLAGRVGEQAGTALDVADVGLDAVELLQGPGGGDDGVWLGEPTGERLQAFLVKRPSTTVGFVARYDRGTMTLGGRPASLEEVAGWCRATGHACWLYLGVPAAPVEVALASWNRSEGTFPDPAEGYSARVLGP